MKKIIFLFVLIFTSITYSQEIKTIDWTTDLNFLKTELAKKHKNLFFKISKQEFDNEINLIINQLDDDTNIETSIKLSQLIAKIGDSHTGLKIPKFFKSRKHIPIKLWWFKEKLYIMGSVKENYDLLGKELISINGFKTERIIDSLNTLFVAENIGMIKRETPNLINNKILLKYFGFSREKDTIYKVELLDSDGELSSFQIKEVSRKGSRKNFVYVSTIGEKPFYIDGRANFEEKYYEDEKIYFIKYRKCISRETVEKYGNKEFAYQHPSFKEFEKKVMQTIKNKEIDKLIFDMRFNGGGSSYLAENLIKEIGKNKTINKKGKLFVAVGRKTYSSAIFNTIDFRENTNAIIVGERTSGKANHYGYTSNFTLPYSEIKVTYSQEFYKLNNDTENTIIPDVIINREFEQYKNGIDPIFKWVKEYK